MSENLQTLLKEALNNNSYDYDAMHNTLKETWMNSFSYLYTLQKNYIEYEELFYFSNDDISHNSKLMGKLYLDKLIYANFNVDYDLIHVYSREEFRRSGFYLNTFTIQDMVKNPKIFLKLPIVIIDDQVIWDYKIRVKKDCTTFILPFRRQFVIKNERNPENDDIVYVDHKIQVLTIDNIYYERLQMNKSNLHFNAIAKSFTIDKSVLSGLPKQSGTMMCSIHYPNAAGRGYELGTALIPLTETDDGFTVSLTDNLNVEMFNSNRDFYVSIFFINRLYHHTFYDGNTIATADDQGTNLLVVQQDELVPYKTPIPVEDFMVFKKSVDTDGYILEKNNFMLDMHYPNIYIVKDENMKAGDQYDFYYYYYNAIDLQYTVLFDFYFQFLADTFSGMKLEEIINDIYYNRMDYSRYTEEQTEAFKTTFDKIISYQYYNHQYGETDFLHRYLPIPGNETKEPIEYKDETLKEWMQVEPWVLRNYVLDQNKLGKSYHLFTNTIDLAARLRTNTETEMGAKSREFDEPRYVFAFNNEKDFPILLNCRVFVDGLMVVDLYQERHLFMDYLYIPADMVTEDSYIEVEIFPSYSFKQDVLFTSLEEEQEITILEPEDDIFPTKADLYYETNDDNKARYNEKLFDITEHYVRGDFLVESDNPTKKPIKFTRLNKFKIKPNSDLVLNIPLTLKFSKVPNGMEVMIDQDGYPSLALVETNFNFNVNYLRIYRNGRLVPRVKYAFLSSFNRPRLLLLDWYNAGDLLYIDVTPYRYTEVYYQEEISKDTTLIDLRGVITKPFDIRYYDVYMNGRKLSLNNVMSITPWEITLVNLKSNYNLEIFEKERDWEYFGLDYTNHMYYFSPDDLFEANYVTEDEKNKLIKDIIDDQKDDRLTIYPNTNDEEKLDWTDTYKYVAFNVFYSYELIPQTYVNGDVLQFSEELLTDEYKEIMDLYCRVPYTEVNDPVELERKQNYAKTLMLDPDIIFEGEDPEHNCYVYMVGHPDEVDQKILDEVITIPTDDKLK